MNEFDPEGKAQQQFCLQDIFENTAKYESGLIVAPDIDAEGNPKASFFSVKIQPLIFQHRAHRVLTMCDVTKLHEN
jgi:hypothetical protein